jgi:hypothetical protein
MMITANGMALMSVLYRADIYVRIQELHILRRHDDVGVRDKMQSGRRHEPIHRAYNRLPELVGGEAHVVASAVPWQRRVLGRRDRPKLRAGAEVPVSLTADDLDAHVEVVG